MIPAYEGEMRAYGLYHSRADKTPPTRNRVLHESDLFKSNLHICVFAPAANLSFSTPPPASIVAGVGFNIEVEILDKDGVRITTGSFILFYLFIFILFIYFFDYQYTCINIYRGSYEHLQDHINIYRIERLTGSETRMHTSYYKTIIDKRASNGVAQFNDIQLLDVHQCARLNITMMLPDWPNLRQPDSYTDFSMKQVFVLDGTNVMYINGTTDGAVLISPCIEVTEQTATQLVMVNNADIKPKIGANCPIEPNIILEIRDSSGKRIYSGPDSSLIVTTIVNPSSACISADSATFQLSDGRATFVGSICEPIGAVKLSFEVTSAISAATLTTVETADIE
ncbi:hypothetical protein KUTeg_002027, partial [Tegillarca granosa]